LREEDVPSSPGTVPLSQADAETSGRDTRPSPFSSRRTGKSQEAEPRRFSGPPFRRPGQVL